MDVKRKKLFLKPNREKSIRSLHPWIFSGAVAKSDSFENGDILTVCDCTGKVLGEGYFNSRCSLAGRMLSFGEEKAEKALMDNLNSAIALRENINLLDITNSYRLVNAESDSIPGLIIDRYNNYFVVQVSTLGMEKLKSLVVDFLKDKFPEIVGIYEKSRIPSRKEEGLSDFEGWLYKKESSVDGKIEVVEYGIKYFVDLENSQKTGLFLDQREMRNLVRRLAKGRTVLNCFSYSAGFSLNALKGQAKKVVSVDSSQNAINQAEANYKLNGFPITGHDFLCEDVFDYLLTVPKGAFDFIILDPPAFVKKRTHLDQAVKAYQRLNSMALERMNSNGLLLTCSCSYYLGKEDFKNMLYRSANSTVKKFRLISDHVQAWDHPLSIYHPEREYLKSALVYID